MTMNKGDSMGNLDGKGSWISNPVLGDSLDHSRCEHPSTSEADQWCRKWLTHRIAARERDLLSGLPGLSDYEQEAEVERRLGEAELVQVNERWYELVDLSEEAHARLHIKALNALNAERQVAQHGPGPWRKGDPMPERRPSVWDSRDVFWEWSCDEEAYVSSVGESCSWSKMLRLFGPVYSGGKIAS